MKHKLILAAVAWLLLTLLGQKSALAGDFETVWSVQTHYSASIHFSHNSRWIVSNGDSPNTYVYNVVDGSLFTNELPSIDAAFFSNDDSHIMGVLNKGSDTEINRDIAYFNIATLENDSLYEKCGNLSGPLFVTSDGKFIVAPTMDGYKIWDEKTGKIIKSKKVAKDPQAIYYYNYQIAVSNDNSKIYLSTANTFPVEYPKPSTYPITTIKIYDFETLDSIGCILTILPGNSQLCGFELSHDCSMLAIGYANADVGVKIFRLDSMKLIRQLNINGYACTGFKFTKDDKYLITIGNGAGYYAIDLRNIETGAIEKHVGGGWNTIDISSDEKYLAASSTDEVLLLKFKINTIVDDLNLIETIYPNPSTGEILISIPETQIKEIKILSINGELLENVNPANVQINPNTLRLNLSSYANGAYIIYLTGTNYQKTYKVIINK